MTHPLSLDSIPSRSIHRPVDSTVDTTVDLGSPRGWARDLGLVGTFTALGLAFANPMTWGALALTTLFAAGIGAGLGALVPRLMHPQVRKVPWLVLAVAGIGLGACWGGAAGLGGALLTGTPWMRATELGATAGAFQLGWLWLPLLLSRARGRRGTSLTLAACALAPLVGWGAALHVG